MLLMVASRRIRYNPNTFCQDLHELRRAMHHRLGEDPLATPGPAGGGSYRAQYLQVAGGAAQQKMDRLLVRLQRREAALRVAERKRQHPGRPAPNPWLAREVPAAALLQSGDADEASGSGSSLAIASSSGGPWDLDQAVLASLQSLVQTIYSRCPMLLKYKADTLADKLEQLEQLLRASPEEVRCRTCTCTRRQPPPAIRLPHQPLAAILSELTPPPRALKHAKASKHPPCQPGCPSTPGASAASARPAPSVLPQVRAMVARRPAVLAADLGRLPAAIKQLRTLELSSADAAQLLLAEPGLVASKAAVARVPERLAQLQELLALPGRDVAVSMVLRHPGLLRAGMPALQERVRQLPGALRRNEGFVRRLLAAQPLLATFTTATLAQRRLVLEQLGAASAAWGEELAAMGPAELGRCLLAGKGAFERLQGLLAAGGAAQAQGVALRDLVFMGVEQLAVLPAQSSA
jgi:hypothetical protein